MDQSCLYLDLRSKLWEKRCFFSGLFFPQIIQKKFAFKISKSEQHLVCALISSLCLILLSVEDAVS